VDPAADVPQRIDSRGAAQDDRLAGHDDRGQGLMKVGVKG
jgi:hypothetical protein